MSTPCCKNIHHWTDPADAAKCCQPHWRRDLVLGDGENQQKCADVMIGRRWIYIGPAEEAPLEAHWIEKDGKHEFVEALEDEGPPEDEESFDCSDCGDEVKPEDPYYSTPCGTFCIPCMEHKHAPECGVCASEFDLKNPDDSVEA